MHSTFSTRPLPSGSSPSIPSRSGPATSQLREPWATLPPRQDPGPWTPNARGRTRPTSKDSKSSSQLEPETGAAAQPGSLSRPGTGSCSTALPSVPTPPRSVYSEKEASWETPQPPATSEPSVIRPAATPSEATPCLPSPCLLRSLAAPQGSRASQLPPLGKAGAQNRGGNKDKTGARAPAGSWSPVEALGGCLPEATSSGLAAAAAGGGEGRCTSGHPQPAAALAGQWGIYTEASWAVGRWPQRP